MTAIPHAVCGLAVAALLVGPSHAQSFAPATNASYALDLDTADGNYSAFECDDIGGLNALHATLAVRRLGADAKAAPSVVLWLARDEESVALRVIAVRAGGPLIFYLTHAKAGAVISDEMFLTSLAAADKAEVEIAWTAAGVVSAAVKSPQSLAVSATGERHQAALSGTPTKVRVTSSSGEFELKPLVLGRISP